MGSSVWSTWTTPPFHPLPIYPPFHPFPIQDFKNSLQICLLSLDWFKGVTKRILRIYMLSVFLNWNKILLLCFELRFIARYLCIPREGKYTNCLILLLVYYAPGYKLRNFPGNSATLKIIQTSVQNHVNHGEESE